MQKSATHAAHTAEVSLVIAHDVDQVILQHSVERLLQRLNERHKEHVYTRLSVSGRSLRCVNKELLIHQHGNPHALFL